MGPEDQEDLSTWEEGLASELASAEALKEEVESSRIDWLGDGLAEEPETEPAAESDEAPAEGDLILVKDQALSADDGLYRVKDKAAGRPRRAAKGKGRAKRARGTAGSRPAPRKVKKDHGQGILADLQPMILEVIGAIAEIMTAMVFQEVQWAIVDLRRALLHRPGRPRAIQTTIGRRAP
jgi:hypothetical protein